MNELSGIIGLKVLTLFQEKVYQFIDLNYTQKWMEQVHDEL